MNISHDTAPPAINLTQRDIYIVAMIGLGDASLVYPESSKPRAYYEALSDVIRASLGNYTETEFSIAIEKLMGS